MARTCKLNSLNIFYLRSGNIKTRKVDHKHEARRPASQDDDGPDGNDGYDNNFDDNNDGQHMEHMENMDHDIGSQSVSRDFNPQTSAINVR